MQTILLFALPEEHAAFRRVTGSWRLISRSPFRAFVCTAPAGAFTAVETGMGCDQALGALRWVMARTRPDLIVTAGFAGSLSAGLAVGDVCLGEDFCYLDEAAEARLGNGWAAPRLDQATHSAEARATGEGGCESRASCSFRSGGQEASTLSHFFAAHQLNRTRIVTVNRPQPKPFLAALYTDQPSITDMESYVVARFCCERRIPFLSLRAVSDGLRDEIDFDLSAVSDGQGRVSIPLVLASVARSPRLMRSYYRSWKRSQTAARSLAGVLAGLMVLSAEELCTLGQAVSSCGT